MAEQRKQDPALATATTAESPGPSAGTTKKKVAVAWPSDQFVVEGLPVVNRTGVAVTAEQYKTLEEAAKKSGVKLREVNG